MSLIKLLTESDAVLEKRMRQLFTNYGLDIDKYHIGTGGRAWVYHSKLFPNIVVRYGSGDIKSTGYSELVNHKYKYVVKVYAYFENGDDTITIMEKLDNLPNNDHYNLQEVLGNLWEHINGDELVYLLTESDGSMKNWDDVLSSVYNDEDEDNKLYNILMEMEDEIEELSQLFHDARLGMEEIGGHGDFFEENIMYDSKEKIYKLIDI